MTNPTAAPHPISAVQFRLIEDMRRHIKATTALFETLPEKARASHVVENAKDLVSRADELLKDANEAAPVEWVENTEP